MKNRLEKIKKIYKISKEDEDKSNEDKNKSMAKKIMSIPKDSLISIICIILKENEDIKNAIYDKIFLEEKKLDDLA
tara:strand:+ start:275 stop:502 length:228 start_codon:yes stop_codon:yes gene_type:complete